MKKTILGTAIYHKTLGRENWFEPIELQIKRVPSLRERYLKKAQAMRAKCIIEKLQTV